MYSEKYNLHEDTKAVHSGVYNKKHYGSLVTPIYMTSTYKQESPGVFEGFDYARTDNPTRSALQESLASLENAKYALAFSSGMGAITTLLHTLKAGDEVLSINDVYGGTYRLFENVMKDKEIVVKFIEMNKEAILQAVTSKTKMIWVESPTNPLLKVVDISTVSSIAKEHNILLAVDNTFATPYFQKPLNLGADVVLHSLTKYVNGHCDVVSGAIMTNDDVLYDRVKYLQNAMGATPSAFDAFLIQRGIRTFPLRMRQHAQSALKIAQFLEGHTKVKRVLYPGLASHPQYEIAKKQMSGFSGMISFEIAGNLDNAKHFLEAVSVFSLAESLGGVKSLIEHPAIMTHASIPKEEREKIGITDTLIRLSVGIEHSEDLIADLEKALGQVKK